jgi:hypothetical protein
MLCNVLAPTPIAPPLPFLSSRDLINQFTVHLFSSLLFSSRHFTSLILWLHSIPHSCQQDAVRILCRALDSHFLYRAGTGRLLFPRPILVLLHHNTPNIPTDTHLCRESDTSAFGFHILIRCPTPASVANPPSACDHPAHCTSLDRPSVPTIGHWTVLIGKRTSTSTRPLLPSKTCPADLTLCCMCPRCVPSTAPTRRWPHLQPWPLQ